MNKKIKTTMTALFVSMLLLSVSCKQNTEEKAQEAEKTEATAPETEETEGTSEQGKEYTSAYVCPMHCEGSGSDEEGNCPKCGMAYVANEDHKDNEHSHE